MHLDQPPPNAHRWLFKALPQWVDAGLLGEEQARAIRARLGEPPSGVSLTTLILGVLGAVLVGGGVILIFAYNWPQLDRVPRAILAFLPLVSCQALAVWVLLKQNDSTAWREGAATGLIASVGASIGLIAQTYQMGGPLAGFLFTWSLLALPVLYALRSVVAFLFCQVAILVFAGGRVAFDADPSAYWWLLAATLPFFGWTQRDFGSPRAVLCRLIVALTLPVAIGMLGVEQLGEDLLPFFYSVWFAATIALEAALQREARWWQSPLATLGAVGMAILLLIFTYRGLWAEMAGNLDLEAANWVSGSALALLLASGGAIFGLARGVEQKHWWVVTLAATPLLFLPLFVNAADTFGHVLANLLAFGLAVLSLTIGLRQDRFGLTNYGLLLLGALILLRFFDSDLSFLARGLVFIVLGVAFLLINWRLSQQRRQSNQGATT